MKDKVIFYIEKTVFFLFLVLTFFFPISGAVVEVCFSLIAFCFFLRLFLKPFSLEPVKQFFAPGINLALLVFYLILGFSIFFSPDPGKSFDAWFFKWGEGVLLFYFAQVFLNRKQVVFLLHAAVFSCFLVSLSGIYQKITGIDFIRHFDINKAIGFEAIRSTFNHYNNFAAYLVFLFFINCGMLLADSKRWVKALRLAFIVLVVVDIFLTYSRTAWVSMFTLSMFLLFFLDNKKIRFSVFLFMVVFVSSLMFTPLIRTRFMSIIQGIDSGRFGLWHAGLMMFKDSPFFGKGLGLFMGYLSDYNDVGNQYAHNCYIQVLAEAGILALLSFLWFLFEIFRAGIISLKKRIDYKFLGIFCALLTFALGAFFDNHFYSLKLATLFWLFSGFFAVYIADESRKKSIENKVNNV